ncbi:MAG: SUF system Fe-S cluster assembly protein [Blastocatellia bacterium]|nr:SUF system Fe-S cluster assembly protein [Blastocatellia bacterium]
MVLEAQVIEVLQNCFDPEIPVNIYDLGLIYEIKVEPAGKVEIKMTLTAPNCPVAGTLPGEVESRVQAVPGVTDVNVELVWDPPWCTDRMSEAARLELGLM